MGLPEIVISFKKAASSAISRSSRGLVALLVNDTTKDQFITPYTRMSNVKKDEWDNQTLTYLKMVFRGAPNKVIVVRVLQKDGASDLISTLKEIGHLNIDYVVYPDFDKKDLQEVKSYLAELHEKGKKMKAVLPDAVADCPWIINYITGVTVRFEDEDAIAEYSAAQYTPRIAGILAGLPLSQSCTYYELPEVVDAQVEEDADAAIDEGKLLLVFDGDTYKIGRGVTSLTTVSDEMPEEFKKIKIVEGMDVVKHDIYATFEKAYVGKVANSYDNKQMFVGAVCEYFKNMEGTVLSAESDNYVEVSAEGNRKYLEENGYDTSDMTEQQLKEADTGSFMILTGKIKFLDAAEDLSLEMFI